MHQLRRAPDYRDMLALPLQMHLAKLIREYALPTIRTRTSSGRNRVSSRASEGYLLEKFPRIGALAAF